MKQNFKFRLCFKGVLIRGFHHVEVALIVFFAASLWRLLLSVHFAPSARELDSERINGNTLLTDTVTELV